MANTRDTLGYQSLALRAANQARNRALVDQQRFGNDSGAENDIGSANGLGLVQGQLARDDAKEKLGLTLAAKEKMALALQKMKQDAPRDELKDMLTMAKITNYGNLGRNRDATTADRAEDNLRDEAHFGAKLKDKQEEDEFSHGIKSGQLDVNRFNADTNRAAIPFKGAFGGMNVIGYTHDGLPILDNRSSAPATAENPAEGLPPADTNRIEDAPADKATYDAAVKALGSAKDVSKAFDSAINGMSSVPTEDFGGASEPTFLGVPKGVPGIGGIGVNVPGNNQIQEKLVDYGAENNPIGRFLLNMTTGHAELGNRPEGTFKKKVEDRELARSAAQDLVSKIGVLRLGTTSSAKQDERIDRILGLANDKAFGHDKERTLKILSQMQDAYNSLRGEHEYIVKHKRIPLGNVPAKETVTGPSAEDIQINPGSGNVGSTTPAAQEITVPGLDVQVGPQPKSLRMNPIIRY